MQISHYADAPTVLCDRARARHESAPTEPMALTGLGWAAGCPVPKPTAEDLQWSGLATREEDCADSPTEEVSLAAMRAVPTQELWFDRPAPLRGPDPVVRTRSTFECVARAALLLIAAWLPPAILLLAS